MTANIALGIPGSDSVVRCLSSLIKLYGWKIFPYLLTSGRFGSIFNYNTGPGRKGIAFFSAHSTVRPVLALIAEEKPDIVVLTEILHQIHEEPLRKGLEELGFAHIGWGKSLQPPHLTATAVVASRLPCLDDGFAPTMTQLQQISGGAGISGLRLEKQAVTIVGAHLTVGLRSLSERQVQDLIGIYKTEGSNGRICILAGDFNQRAKGLDRIPSFRALGLSTVTKQPTTLLGPTFLRFDYDHVFLPPGWRASDTHYRSFGSDHLAVVSELISP
ncbi:MAG: hypothetical protein QOE22_580 [Candidatus Parcubacteria bacterium]|nr:hypothetical protein [Candidatus Parcubacteria bacterium]